MCAVVTSRETLKVLQNDLFPKAKELGINTADYIGIVLKHSRISKEDKEYLKKGVKWLNESAVDMYKKQYTKLLPVQRQKVLKSFANESWGSSWLATVLRYTFEASFGDPIYGSNKMQAGWTWLEFTGGEPRPKKVYL
ncbi:Tat (Twin-arginine translocation) pathway signal sequence domain protein [hydrothermal vent metagenome]|uniref:Tat (Twin-arginine translocation) pathway signal sequence domain protein n=1 Tax=hydrothermal vent metagenome TaxID=652676 RepID=A0A1W1CLF2_9ZZZZ